MKKFYLLTVLLFIILTGCNFKLDYKKIVPITIDRFANEFIGFVHKGNIDTCLSLVLPEMNTDEARKFLQNCYSNINSLNLDSVKIINANKTSLMGKDGFTNYWIDYEYNTNPKFLYIKIGIREQNGRLTVTAFNGNILDESLSKTYNFTFKDKGIKHFLFFCISILVPVFILFTLFFAIKTKLNKKWLWIIGIILGFTKFSINWTTGQVGFSLINFMILGAGIIKSGNVAPWILSFSIPIVSIIFWIRKLKGTKTTEKDLRPTGQETIITKQD
jgi:hypothetical protein